MINKNEVSGFLLIDKPVDWTSHDVVGYLRRITGIKKIGHAGTLDPFATGLLIVGVGRAATKQLDSFKSMQKEYIARIQLGATSDTQDPTGTIITSPSQTHVLKRDIKDVLNQFVGAQQQTPPMYSAKKVKGKKLYELARKGIHIERQPNDIHIFDISLLDVQYEHWFRSLYKPTHIDSFDIRVRCSTGTYIRTLAHDIGQKLGSGGYCKTLHRTQIGVHSVKKAKKPTYFTKKNWRSRLKQL